MSDSFKSSTFGRFLRKCFGPVRGQAIKQKYMGLLGRRGGPGNWMISLILEWNVARTGRQTLLMPSCVASIEVTQIQLPNSWATRGAAVPRTLREKALGPTADQKERPEKNRNKKKSHTKCRRGSKINFSKFNMHENIVKQDMFDAPDVRQVVTNFGNQILVVKIFVSKIFFGFKILVKRNF